MKAACLFLFAVISAFGQTTASADQTGAVSGVVTDAVTHLPVKKTMVSASPAQGVRNGTQGTQASVTDASGAFTITNLQAGHYRLQFQQQSYPQARNGGVAKTVDVKPGETATVAVDLIPGAGVSGRVVDEDGDPIMNCIVQPHPAKHPEQGVQLMGMSQSNTDGEYRLSGIPPGKYIVTAQCRQQIFQARPFSAGPDPPPSQGYPMLYYPMATDVKSAQIIELAAGAEKSGVDFQMVPAAVTQVHGTIAPGGPDLRGNNQFFLQLMSPDRNDNAGAAIDPTKGTFEFRQVFPGSYTLVGTNNGSENHMGVWQRIDVGNRPLDITVEVRPAVDLTGKLEIETTGNANPNNPVTPGAIQLMLSGRYAGANSQTQVNNDGTFTMKNVMPIPLRLQVNGPGIFVKSVWLGSTDVTNAPLDLSSGAAGNLRIVVSTNTATLRGSAPAGQIVFAQLIDDSNPFPQSRGGAADQSGQYKMEGLAPGKYRVLVRESGFGQMPDEGGQEVTVREGETAMLDVKPAQ
jgi:hypothetical protein